MRPVFWSLFWKNVPSRSIRSGSVADRPPAVEVCQADPKHAAFSAACRTSLFPLFRSFDGGEGHAGLLGETQLHDVLPRSCLFQPFSNLELDYHVGKHVYVIHNGLILNFNAAKIQIKVEFATVVERISQLALWLKGSVARNVHGCMLKPSGLRAEGSAQSARFCEIGKTKLTINS